MVLGEGDDDDVQDGEDQEEGGQEAHRKKPELDEAEAEEEEVDSEEARDERDDHAVLVEDHAHAAHRNPATRRRVDFEQKSVDEGQVHALELVCG